MKVYSCSMSHWRRAKAQDILFYDVTVKSGDKLFAPSWSLLSDYKSNKITDDQYTKRYLAEMRDSYKYNKQHWLDFINKDEVAIACYCKANGFCHRYLLVDLFEKVCNNSGIEFEYKGEIE